MDGTEHLFLNLFCADAVRAAGPAMFVRRADIVDVFLCLRRNGLACHRLLAVSAEQEAGKQVCLILIRRAAHIPLHHGLDGHEILIGNKCFVRPLDLDPLGFVFRLHNAHLVVWRTALALGKDTDIYLIGEDALDSLVSPLCSVAGLEDGIELHSRRVLILHWRKHAHLIQPCSNATDGEAILVHGKDHLHILADGLIDDELVFVIRRFLVAIGRECPDELTVLLLDLQAGSNFHGYILAVGVVDEVFERDDKGIRLRIAGQAVVSVVDRDKADAELREYLFQIPTAVDVVSRKAAEVFDHDAVNRAFADCVFELFEVRTIEGNAAITIVNERLADDFQIVMPCNVVLANGSLACDGVAFNFVPVFTGQAAVNRRPVNFSGHKNNLRFLFGVIHQIRKTKASASCMRKTR